MSELLERLQRELATARKAQDKEATLLLGTLLADVRNREIELRRAVTDEDVLEVVARGIKRRREAAEMFTAGNRGDLAAQETAQAAMLERFLPAQASDDDIRAAVRAARAAGASTVGAVMGKVAPAFKGRADGGRISAIVREELAAGNG